MTTSRIYAFQVDLGDRVFSERLNADFEVTAIEERDAEGTRLFLGCTDDGRDARYLAGLNARVIVTR